MVRLYLALVLVMPTLVLAGTYRCESDSGHITYSDRPCQGEKVTSVSALGSPGSSSGGGSGLRAGGNAPMSGVELGENGQAAKRRSAPEGAQAEEEQRVDAGKARLCQYAKQELRTVEGQSQSGRAVADERRILLRRAMMENWKSLYCN